MTCWEHLVGAFCAHDSICMRISLSDFSVLISTQNKDRLCKCQAVCFGQLKANFSCADEVHDDNDGDDDGNDGTITTV